LQREGCIIENASLLSVIFGGQYFLSSGCDGGLCCRNSLSKPGLIVLKERGYIKIFPIAGELFFVTKRRGSYSLKLKLRAGEARKFRAAG